MAFRMIKARTEIDVRARRNLQEMVREYLSHRLPWRGIGEGGEGVFVDALLEEIMSQNRRADLDMLAEVFERIKPNLGTSPLYDQAWRGLKERRRDIRWTEALIQKLDGLQHDRILDGTWPDEEIFISTEALEQLLQFPEVAEELRQHLTPEAEAAISAEHARQHLINQILAAAPPLSTGSTDKWGEAQKAKARAEWIERVKQSPLSDLERIRAKQQLNSGSVDGARQIVKEADNQRQQELYDGRYTRWPGLYTPPNKDASCAVPLSVQLFKRLPRVEIERLFRVFGEAQINKALAEAQRK